MDFPGFFELISRRPTLLSWIIQTSYRSSKMDEEIKKIITKKFNIIPRDFQVKAIQTVLEGKDAFIAVPTGRPNPVN